MNHCYFETRDGRCLPFFQIGETGPFCIIIDGCDEFDFNEKSKYFIISDLCDINEISNLSERWRANQPSPCQNRVEGEVERQAKDILDLADIFRMEEFQIMGNGEIVDWLINHYPERIDQVNSVASPPIDSVALSF